jgi:hypothetical protein
MMMGCREPKKIISCGSATTLELILMIDGGPGKDNEFERTHRDPRYGGDVDHGMSISWTFFGWPFN